MVKPPCHSVGFVGCFPGVSRLAPWRLAANISNHTMAMPAICSDLEWRKLRVPPCQCHEIAGGRYPWLPMKYWSFVGGVFKTIWLPVNKKIGPFLHIWNVKCSVKQLLGYFVTVCYVNLPNGVVFKKRDQNFDKDRLPNLSPQTEQDMRLSHTRFCRILSGIFFSRNRWGFVEVSRKSIKETLQSPNVSLILLGKPIQVGRFRALTVE